MTLKRAKAKSRYTGFSQRRHEQSSIRSLNGFQRLTRSGDNINLPSIQDSVSVFAQTSQMTTSRTMVPLTSSSTTCHRTRPALTPAQRSVCTKIATFDLPPLVHLICEPNIGVAHSSLH
ncbi:hypothetical protein ARMSODRAFT_965849 [Armillaria solidipes]|uniref:Uncharacterized protein n=1 Tax=Armillaria solidipes TaxID=1076256 RepID=A0A2H3BCF4_9AGAR|nr:hypothetical protein ARMSODRAFT_965849 [Armillaria solidipes]